jgi:hypothetical protein
MDLLSFNINKAASYHQVKAMIGAVFTNP